jgi:hypothetical protein
MTQLRHLVAVALVVFCLVIVVACSGKTAHGQGTTKQVPAKLTAADLEKLRWIEGTWRGTGEVDKPFFERYRFENATTLAVDSFENEKLEKVIDTTLFELKDGEFGGGSEGSRYVAVGLDDRSIEFGPALKVRNGFRWERESSDIWKATIIFPARENRPASQRVYKMERWPQK